MSTTPTPTFRHPLFDADNHLYETQDSLTKYLPKQYQDATRYVQVDARTKITVRAVIRHCIPIPTFGVVARPGAMKDYLKYGKPDGKSFREPEPRLVAV